jgi:hypothetical protein
VFGLDYSAANYVKVYRGGSVDWDALEWQARAIYAELYRKVDRHTGSLAVGALGPEAAVAGATRIPLPVVREHWGQLVMSRAVTATPSAVTIRDFVAAQTAVQSPAARKRAQRESAGLSHEKGRKGESASRNVTGGAPPVTESDGTKRALSEEKQEEQEEQDPEARAGAPAPAREHTRELTPETAAKAGSPEARRARYAKAYAEGVSSVTGRPFALSDDRERADLANLLPTYALGANGSALRLDALDAWLREQGAAFARAVAGDDPRYTGGLGPRAFERFLRAPASAQTSERSAPRGRPEDVHRQRGWSQTEAERDAQHERQLRLRLSRIPEHERPAEEARIRALYQAEKAKHAARQPAPEAP